IHAGYDPRKLQEDRLLDSFVEISGIPHGRGRLMAVSDGHGNDQTAELAIQNVERIFRDVMIEFHGENIQEVLREVVRRLVDLTQEERLGGATISIVYTPEDEAQAYVAVLGDSPVIVSPDPETIWVLERHTPSNLKEVAAAQARGAVIFRGSLMADHPSPEPGDRSVLMVSSMRGLGDQPFGNRLGREADVYALPLTSGTVIVLGSDGLIRNKEKEDDVQAAAEEIVSHVRRGQGAWDLVQKAIEREGSHSRDNTSAIVHRHGDPWLSASGSARINRSMMAEEWANELLLRLGKILSSQSSGKRGSLELRGAAWNQWVEDVFYVLGYPIAPSQDQLALVDRFGDPHVFSSEDFVYVIQRINAFWREQAGESFAQALRSPSLGGRFEAMAVEIARIVADEGITPVLAASPVPTGKFAALGKNVAITGEQAARYALTNWGGEIRDGALRAQLVGLSSEVAAALRNLQDYQDLVSGARIARRVQFSRGFGGVALTDGDVVWIDLDVLMVAQRDPALQEAVAVILTANLQNELQHNAQWDQPAEEFEEEVNGVMAEAKYLQDQLRRRPALRREILMVLQRVYRSLDHTVGDELLR
ncbi:MAG: protein phosphatase 2C domain-containing protein, partial [Candidatus Omnitrophica bacterium]|nr:protein phosphatase 2C domain-containing protein [Candidatus Omnitrophota bacterium]